MQKQRTKGCDRRSLRTYQKRILTLLPAAVSAVLAAISPYYLSQLVSDLLAGFGGKISLRLLGKQATGLFLLVIGTAAAHYLQLLACREQTAHLQDASEAAGAGLQLAALLVMMLLTQWKLSLLALVLAAAEFCLLLLISLAAERSLQNRNQAYEVLQTYAQEAYAAHQMIRVSCAGEKTGEDFNGCNRALYRAGRQVHLLAESMPLAEHLVRGLGYLLLCMAGAMLLLNGELTLGTLLAFPLYLHFLMNSLTTLRKKLPILHQLRENEAA